METAVVLFIFNRPNLTARVLAEVAKARPKRLFVVADGPRAERPEDLSKCEAARAIIEQIDWDCQVIKKYSETNLGCGRSVASGISWVFQQVEEAIILEDDCLPHPSFFRFCEEMLCKYRDDRRVAHIAGSNFGSHRRKISTSYSFTSQISCWGWATWRRAWQYYDPHVSMWRLLRNTEWLSSIMDDPRFVGYYEPIFDRAHTQNIDHWAWDYQWAFACWANSGLSIQPRCNLISNIGFDEDATHTRKIDHPLANLSTDELSFPLVHPPLVLRDVQTDRIFFEEAIVSFMPRKTTPAEALYARCTNIAPNAVKTLFKRRFSHLKEFEKRLRRLRPIIATGCVPEWFYCLTEFAYVV